MQQQLKRLLRRGLHLLRQQRKVLLLHRLADALRLHRSGGEIYGDPLCLAVYLLDRRFQIVIVLRQHKHPPVGGIAHQLLQQLPGFFPLFGHRPPAAFFQLPATVLRRGGGDQPLVKRGVQQR